MLCIGTLLATVLMPFAGATPGVGVLKHLPVTCGGPGVNETPLAGVRVVVSDDCRFAYVEYRTNAINPSCPTYDSARGPLRVVPERVQVDDDCFVLLTA